MNIGKEWDDNQKILRLLLDACFEIRKNDAFSGCERLANILFRHGNHSVLRPPSRSENDSRRTCTTALFSHDMPKGEGDLVVVHQVVYLLHKFRWDSAMVSKIQWLISEHFDRTGVSPTEELNLLLKLAKEPLGSNQCDAFGSILEKHGFQINDPDIVPRRFGSDGSATSASVRPLQQVVTLLQHHIWDAKLSAAVEKVVKAAVADVMPPDEPDEPTAFTADPVELPTHSERVVQDNLNKEAWEKARALDAIAAKLKDAEELSVDHLFEIIDTLDGMGYDVSNENITSTRKFMDAHWSLSAQVDHLLAFIDAGDELPALRTRLEEKLAEENS